MRVLSRLALLSGCSLALAACADQPLQPLAELPPSLLTGGGCFPQYVAELAPPLLADGSAVFQIPSTIPLKIRVTDCETGAEINTLTPTFSLDRLDSNGGFLEVVAVIKSSSKVDEGTTLRSAGLGQYLFDFSTKLSEVELGGDMLPGLYRLTITSGGQFSDVVVQFQLR